MKIEDKKELYHPYELNQTVVDYFKNVEGEIVSILGNLIGVKWENKEDVRFYEIKMMYNFDIKN